MYSVNMVVEGRIEISVDAESVDKAFEKAQEEFGYADLSNMLVVSSYPDCAYDEEGNNVGSYR